MASIFDTDDTPMTPREPEPPARSKYREGLSSFDVTKGKRRLADMVDRAFQTLEDATVHADYPTAIKAAQIILDRAGFGPKSTVDINATTIDLSALSREELAERAAKVHQMLRSQMKELPVIDAVVTGTVQ